MSACILARKDKFLASFFFIISFSAVMLQCKKDDAKLTPSITGLAPSSGPFGTSVTISGNNFSTLTTNNTVNFNGAEAIVSAATQSQLIVVVPSGAVSGKVTVTVEGLTGISPANFVVDNTPTITGFSPPTATIASTITINGTNFSTIPENNFVGFGAAIGVVTSATATQISVVIPNGAVSGPISLSVNELKTTSANSFTLTPPTITSISPNSGPKWAEVTLTGTGFDALNTNDSVFFNGIAGIIVSTTNTKIIAKVSPTSGTGPVTLRMDGTQCTGPVFTYLSATEVTTVAGSGSSGSSNGTGTAASFNDPISLAIDSTGNVVIADLHNNMIRKMTAAGVVTTVAGSTSIGVTNATGTAASFDTPTAVTLDVTGNIYVADANNQLIRKIVPGGIVSTYAGSGSPGANNGPAATATFNIPHGVAVDLSGNVYVADNDNDLIRKITPDGTVSTLAGQSGTPGASNGTGTAASFTNPWALTVDRFGNVYVADTFNHLIRKITPGGLVTTVAGSGTQGNTDGTGTAASFNTPTGIAVDYAGNLYVADFDNSLIRKITPGGVVSTLAGIRGTTGSTDGVQSVATFNHPYGVCVSASGKVVYVADAVNDLIRKITVE
jgi:sugar lactone lactonase YvrE